MVGETANCHKVQGKANLVFFSWKLALNIEQKRYQNQKQKRFSLKFLKNIVSGLKERIIKKLLLIFSWFDFLCLRPQHLKKSFAFFVA